MKKNNYLPDSPYVIDNVGKFTDELDLLLSVSTPKQYRAGEIVCLQGEVINKFYFIEEGKIKLSLFKEDGSEKIFAIQENNTFFGESAAFDRYPQFATATVLEDSTIRAIHIKDAKELIREHPEISFLVMNAITRKLRLLALQVEDLAFLDAEKRVARVLLKLMQEVGEKVKEGLTIRKKITHEDIASLTGLSRVTVTNILNYLQTIRIIRKGRRVITVTDQEKLASLLVEEDVTENIF